MDPTKNTTEKTKKMSNMDPTKHTTQKTKKMSNMDPTKNTTQKTKKMSNMNPQLFVGGFMSYLRCVCNCLRIVVSTTY
jgi:hypothetical protein